MFYARVILAALFVIGFAETEVHAQRKFQSHPPQRPLAQPSKRAIAPGPAFFVDADKGNDANGGTKAKPWKTIQHAVEQLRPGDTLYLRGGIYYEHVHCNAIGTAKSPITIRSFPGELAILDGGLREFYESPETAWEPAPDGVPGEFRSTKTYPDLGGRIDSTNVLGNFGDSMVPLHGYRFLRDLRSSNVYWHANVRKSDTEGIYCGPGVFYNLKTGRIHIRLAHTKMNYLPDGDNYTGETDPRKIPLVIAGMKNGPALVLENARHVRLQDLVVRGSRVATVEIADCENIELDGIYMYGGSTPILVRDTIGLRLVNCACRGIAAPWTFRGSLKYRAIEARLFSASGWTPTGKGNRDFELAYSEFTDCVDGVFIGNVKNVWFHHNLLDNVSDDGIFLTAGTAYDGTTPGGNVHIYQNRLSRCLTTFAFGVGHGRQKALSDKIQTGSGVWIYRNIFDFRRPVMYQQPSSPKQTEVTSKGRVGADHGGPAWEPMIIYHNTIIGDDQPRYTYGTNGLGDHLAGGAKRRVLNNIVTMVHTVPGYRFPTPDTDFLADGNVLWSVVQGPMTKEKFLTKFRQSKEFLQSKKRYLPGWGANDQFADPKFAAFTKNWKQTLDLRLQKTSPAVNAGVRLPTKWQDPIASHDQGKPDVGAMPLGTSPWRVGVRGRMTVFGEKHARDELPKQTVMAFPVSVSRPGPMEPAAVVEGYPARDAPLVAFALRRQRVPVDVYPKKWLPVKDYDKYRLVALVGDLARAKIEPRTYTAEELKQVHRFLTDGGTLLMTLRGRTVFATPHGRAYLQSLAGASAAEKPVKVRILQPRHAWVMHLDPKEDHPWLERVERLAGEHALRVSKGERIIGTPGGYASLYELSVGKGRMIYVGWEIAHSLPKTRAKKSTLDAERMFEDQMRILLRIVEDVYRR